MTATAANNLPIVRNPPRETLPKDANLCEYCSAKCCQYFALPIDEPETKDDFDHIRWYMYHGNVHIFVDEGTWFLMVLNKCDNLLEDNRCGVYEIRPEICREYSTDNCEYDGDGVYDMYFETPEQLYEYTEAMLPPSPRPAAKNRQLPVLES